MKKLKKLTWICFAILGVGGILYGSFALLVGYASRNEAQWELSHYNSILPQEKVQLSRSIKDYDILYLNAWGFESLTNKVSEDNKYEDYWICGENEDVLFCSNEHLYVYNRKNFDMSCSAPRVREIRFSAQPSYVIDSLLHEEESGMAFTPGLSSGETLQLAKILMSDDTQPLNAEKVTYLCDAKGQRQVWSIFFRVYDTEQMCYDGLLYEHEKQYYILWDSDAQWYLQEVHSGVQLLPTDIGDKIMESYNKTGDGSVS